MILQLKLRSLKLRTQSIFRKLEKKRKKKEKRKENGSEKFRWRKPSQKPTIRNIKLFGFCIFQIQLAKTEWHPKKNKKMQDLEAAVHRCYVKRQLWDIWHYSHESTCIRVCCLFFNKFIELQLTNWWKWNSLTKAFSCEC